MIFLTRRRRIQRAVHLGGVATGLILALTVGLVAGAYWLGYEHSPHPAADPRPDLYAAAMRVEYQNRKQEVDAALAEARRSLDALALRLSELQARAIRLDALGGRLVELADMDVEEFGFGSAPARGGPAPDGVVDQNRVPDFVGDLEQLAARLELREQELTALEISLVSSRLAADMHPQGRPVLSGWLSSAFGWRSDPLTGQRSFHYGLDFAGKPGSPIVAVASGVVVFAGRRPGHGQTVELDHGNGYLTRYAHNKKNLVRIGQRVAKGERIALMGSTGRSTGTHVHLEVLHNGKPLNPIQFIRAARTER